MQRVLQQIGVAQIVPVENIPGAAGTIGLARFTSAERGRSDVAMVSGLIMLAAIVTHGSPVTLRDVTPIARLTGEYEVIVVPASSPHRTLQDLLAAFKARPESMSWGGGSAGGSDQILAGLVADAIGVAPRRVNYIAFSGGGEMLASLLGSQVSVGVNGLAEMEPQIAAGTLRALAISSPERLQGVDIPTLHEQGVAIDFINWRSLVAPPGISPVQQRRLVAAAETMARSPEWQALLARYHWLDRFQTGRDFEQFVTAEEIRVTEVLRKLGLGRESAPPQTVVATGYPFVVLTGLALTAVAAFVPLLRQQARSRARAASGARETTADSAESAAGSPLAARATGASAAPRTAESAARRGRPLLWIALGMTADVLLLESAGFVLASTILFWCVARAFDTRRPLRDLLFALATSIASFLLFVRVLDLSLPAGLLAGWL